MAKRIPEEELQAIEAVVRAHPNGFSIQDIARKLGTDIPRRTLQYWLKYLVDENRLVTQGERRWLTYRIPAAAANGEAAAGEIHEEREEETHVPVSKIGADIQHYA